MARSVDIVIPSSRASAVLQDVERLEGVIGVRVQEGISGGLPAMSRRC